MTDISPAPPRLDFGGASPAALVQALVPKDFPSFVAKAFEELVHEPLERSDYLELLSRKLEQVISGEVRRLIICLPPRVLKSHVVSVCLPAFLLGQNPSEKILLISHKEGLAEDFAYRCMQLMATDWYRAAFPATVLAADFARRDHFKTTMGGELIATALGGAITGEGGRTIIIDDPLDAKDASTERREKVNELYYSKIQSRLNNQAVGRILVVAQRLHPNDLCGFLAAQGVFELLSVPLIAEAPTTYRVGAWSWTRPEGDVLRPQSHTPEVIEMLRRTVPPHVFLTQYQQAPTLLAAGLVKAEWFPEYDPVPPAAEQMVLSWDCGQTAGPNSSYSVALVFRTEGRHLYLVDVWRRQVEFTDLKLHALDLARRHPKAIHLVEEAALGRALIGVFEELGLRVERIKQPTASKQARLEAVLDMLQDGRVLLPRHPSWRTAFLDEITELPFSRFDDQGDALTQALSWLRNDFKPKPPPSFGHSGGGGGPKPHPMRDPRAGPMNYIPRGRIPRRR
ncbi:MAG TPA: hypothetical protein VN805_06240 [Caulobacteraceae bacterium]|nr:hypothetical protein [Caulobacteraceae bacterium]